MTVYGTTVSADNVKLKYRERYVTEGENERSLAYPSGCYRGFIPEDSTVPDMRIHLKIDPLSFGYDTDSFAVFNRYNDSGEGWSLSIREPTDTVIDLTDTAFDPIPAGVTYLYVYIYAEYEVGQATNVEYRVSEIDPTIADPDIIMIGRIPVTAGLDYISFDISVPATWVDVLTPRTYPGPTSAELITSLGAGDKFWGYYDSLSAWRTPTVDEKKAMVNANTPNATNPFATVDETRDLYEAEWTDYDVTIDPTASVDGKQKIALSGDWYIGNGARASDAARYFKVYSKDALVMGYDASFALDYGGIRPIRLWDTAGTSTLDPSTDSDTEGFYTDPQIQIYMDTEQTVTQGFTIAGYKKKTHGTKAQAPVDAIEFPSGHAQNVSVKRLSSPPIWGETSITSDDERNGLQDVVHDLHKRSRGPVARSLSATNLNMSLHKLGATTDHEQGGCDTHPYSIENVYPKFAEPFVDGSFNSLSVRKILPWRIGGVGPKIIIVGMDNSVSGPTLGYMDPATGAYTLRYLRLDMIGEGFPGTRWVFQDACVDDTAIYVRLADDSVVGDNRIIKILYGIGLDPAWPTGGVSIGNLSPLVTTALAYANRPKNANLINANLNYLAANDQTTVVTGQPANVGGVHIIKKSDGSVLRGNGTGDFVTHGGSPLNYAAHCDGPIVSDGTNIYFTIHEEQSGGGSTLFNHIGMCQIADPTNTSIPGWNSLYPLSGGTDLYASDLIFDGFFLWAFAGDPAYGATTPDFAISQTAVFYGWTAGTFDVLGMTGYATDTFGPAVFDGKDIWHLTKSAARDSCGVHRLSPRAGVQDLGSSGSEYADVIKEKIGAIGPDLYAAVGGGFGHFSVGAIAFDGEDIWYSLEGSSDGSGTLSGLVFQIPNIKDI